MLMGFDKAEQRMKVCRDLEGRIDVILPSFDSISFLLQDLMERLDSLLCGDSSESLKSLCLKLLLCLVTVRKHKLAVCGK